MKKTLTKLLTLLGVFLFLGAGNADAYWVKFASDFNGWDYGTGYEPASNGIVTKTYKASRSGGHGFKVQVDYGNNNVKTYSNNSQIAFGQWTTLYENNGNSWFDTENEAEYTFEWNDATKQVRVTKVESSSTNPVNYGWRIQGPFTTSGTWEYFPMNKTSNANEYSVEITPTQPKEYDFGLEKYNTNGNSKIAWYWTNNNTKVSSTPSTLDLYEEDNNNGHNPTFNLDPNVTYTFTWNESTNKLTISGGGSTTDPTPETGDFI